MEKEKNDQPAPAPVEFPQKDEPPKPGNGQPGGTAPTVYGKCGNA